MPQLLEWHAANPLDVLALQETKLPDADFPKTELEARGWRLAFAGQKTYNGVAILARAPLEDVVVDLPGITDPQRRLVAATVGAVRLINVYVPNGQSVGSEKYTYKLAWLAAFEAYLRAEMQRHPNVLVMGDFNIAPEDRDVHDPVAWEGSVLVSAAERGALGRLLALGLEDVFRRFEQPPAAYSWWDYRQGAYRRNNGLRIDLILATAPLAARCLHCRIDREPRTWERPSDHAPCTAVFDI
jgi:exodeoxyribonuclease-3